MSLENKTYYVGNVLRGYFMFQASSDQEAVELGAIVFAAHFPSEFGRTFDVMTCVGEGETKPASEYEGIEVPKHTGSFL